jgi:hypothetical protein
MIGNTNDWHDQRLARPTIGTTNDWHGQRLARPTIGLLCERHSGGFRGAWLERARPATIPGKTSLSPVHHAE